MASQLQTIQISGAGVDFSPRVAANNTVVASPALAAETVIASIPAIQSAVVQGLGVVVFATCAYTVGTSGASARYRIRTGVTAGAGTVLFDSGVTTAGIAAAALVVESIQAFDTASTFPGASYCLTLTIGSGAATSTVSAVSICALVI